MFRVVHFYALISSSVYVTFQHIRQYSIVAEVFIRFLFQWSMFYFNWCTGDFGGLFKIVIDVSSVPFANLTSSSSFIWTRLQSSVLLLINIPDV